MVENKYARILIRAVISFAVFIGFHYILCRYYWQKPFAFDIILDLIGPLAFTITETQLDNRIKK